MKLPFLLICMLTSLSSLAHSRAVNASMHSEADLLYKRRDRPGSVEQACKRLKLKLVTSPLDTGLLWRYGRALVAYGERQRRPQARRAAFDQALDAENSALDIDPELLEARYWKTTALLRRGRYALALSEARNAVADQPYEATLHHLLGEILWQAPRLDGGDRRKAVSEFERALDLSGKYASVYVSLAEAYAVEGRQRDALAVLDKLEQLRDPEDPAQLADESGRLIRLRQALRK